VVLIYGYLKVRSVTILYSDMPHHYLHRPLNFSPMPPLSCSSHHASPSGSHALVRESHTPLCGLRAATRSSSSSFLPPHSLCKLLFSGLYYFFFLLSSFFFFFFFKKNFFVFFFSICFAATIVICCLLVLWIAVSQLLGALILSWRLLYPNLCWFLSFL